MPIVNTQMYRLQNSDYQDYQESGEAKVRRVLTAGRKEEEKEAEEEIVKKSFPWIFLGIAFLLLRKK